MPERSGTVLVTSGNGNQARSVIPRLAAAGFRVRAMRRSDRPGPGSAELGAHEVVIGNANVLRMLLGREPASFVQFIRRHFGLSG